MLDLNEIVADMETMLHRIIGDDVSVGVRLAPDLAPVEADRAQIERVILNLAANARDAMPDGGALTIETANVELDAEQVASHGEGAPGARTCCWPSATPASAWTRRSAAHLFEPFFTTKGRRRHRPRAGDRVRRGQAERRRHLRLQRARPRHDVQDLPARPPRRARGAEPAGAEPETVERGTETILVVEDDAAVRELVRLMLEANGYQVLTVDDADEAARAVPGARRRRVDLLLTDVVMPEVNGRALAERLGEIAPDMRILFMSGYSDEAVHRHGVLGEQRRVPGEAVHRARADPQGPRGPRRPAASGGRASSAAAARRRAARARSANSRGGRAAAGSRSRPARRRSASARGVRRGRRGRAAQLREALPSARTARPATA